MERSRKYAAKRLSIAAAVAGLVQSILPSAARATDYTFTANANQNWDNAANWTPSSAFPSTTGDTATFSTSSGAGTVSFDGQTLTVGSIVIDGTGGVSANNVVIGQSGNGILDIGGAPGGSSITYIGSGNFSNPQAVAGDLDVTGALDISDQASSGLLSITGSLSGSGDITLDGSASSSNGISGNNSSYSGQITINSGTWGISNDAAAGSNPTIILAGGTLGLNNSSKNYNVTGNASIVNPSTNGKITGVITVSPGVTLSLNNGGGNPTFFPGLFAGQGNLAINGPARPIQFDGSVANTLSGTTTVTGGGLTLNDSGGVAVAGALQVNTGAFVQWLASNQVSTTSPIILNGGSIQPNTFSNTAGTLQVLNASSIDFDNAVGGSVFGFANSSAVTWSPFKALDITNWGVGSADQIDIASAGLTATQLGQIRFINPAGFAAGTYSAEFSGNQIVPNSIVATSTQWNSNGGGSFSDGTKYTAGAPSFDTDVLFGNAPGITAPSVITLSTDSAVNSITFDNSNSYTIAGSNSLTVVSTGASPITVNSGFHTISAPLILNGTGTYTFNLAASTGLTLGSVNLSGNVFSSTGNGTLVTGDLSNTPIVSITSTGNTTIGASAPANGFVIGGSGDNTAGAISNTNQVTVNGTGTNVLGAISNVVGTVTLRGAGNTTTGSMTNVNLINIYEDGNHNVGDISNTNGFNIQVSGAGNDAFGNISSTGDIGASNGGNFTVGNLTTVGNVTVSGDVTTALGNVLTATSLTVSNSGASTIGSIGNVTGATNITTGLPSTIGAISNIQGLTLSGAGSETITSINNTNGQAVSLNGPGAYSVGPVSNTGAVSATSTGNLSFGAMTSVGAVTLSGATLNLGSISVSPTNTVSLTSTGALTVGTISGATTVMLSPGAAYSAPSISASGLVTVAGAGSGSIGSLSTSVGLTLSGTGTTTLNTSNSYSGTTTVGSGGAASTLAIGNNNALGSSSLVVVGTTAGAGGTPVFANVEAVGGSVVLPNNLTFTALNVTGSNNITFNGTFTPQSNAGGTEAILDITNTGLTTFAGNFVDGTPATSNTNLHLRGTGNVVFSGNFTNNTSNKTWEVGNTAVAPGTYSGVATFSGSNNVSGQFIAGAAAGTTGVNNNGITIAVGSSTAFVPSTAPVNNVMIFNSGVTLEAVNANQTITRTDDRAASITFAGSQNLDFTAAHALEAYSPAGFTNVSWALNTTGGARIQANGIGQNGTNASLTLTGLSSGILEVDGTSTYAGTTAINGGTFLADNATGSATGAAAVTIGANGTLGGSGLISSGSNTLTNNGAITPGDVSSSSTGALTINAPIAFGANSSLNIRLDGTTPGSAAGDYSQLNDTTSTISLAGSPTLNVSLVSGFTPITGSTFYILSQSGSAAFTGTFAGLAQGAQINLGGGYTGTLTYLANWTGTQATSTLTGGNDVAISINAVPEPTSLGILAVGSVGLLGRLRRKASNAI